MDSTIGAKSARINIPVTPALRKSLRRLAKRNGVSMTEFSRQALARAIAAEERSEKLAQLAMTAKKHAKLINTVGEEWSATELDGMNDDEV
ncbi:MAG: hypothetical protein OEM52_06325 [bacterium]|nr:hypothetical protein [bacterium]